MVSANPIAGKVPLEMAGPQKFTPIKTNNKFEEENVYEVEQKT